MKRKLRILLGLLGSVALGVTMASCEKSDVERTEDKIERGVDKAGDKVEKAGDKIEEKTDR